MPSIFIWKSQTPNDSKKLVRYYSGSNWFLEDDDYSSNSYKFLEQIVISGLNDSVIIFNTMKMPQDWVGSDLLEVTQIPYKKIKEDNFGLLEQIGDWMRFISKEESIFTSEILEIQFDKVIKWCAEKRQEKPRTTSNTTNYNRQDIIKENTNKSRYDNSYQERRTISQQQIQQEFQKFLIKYTTPINAHHTQNQRR